MSELVLLRGQAYDDGSSEGRPSNAVILFRDWQRTQPGVRLIAATNFDFEELGYKAALEEAKKQIIVNAFIQAGWSYTQTARVLDIRPAYLLRLIRKMNLEDTLDRTYKVLGTWPILGDAERTPDTATAPGTAHPIRTAGETISHYRIIGMIGEGGMGVVYKAKDIHLGRIVALKLPGQSILGNKQEKARFLRGAKAAAALNHANICTIHDFGEVGGQPFIVMEYVAGETLRRKTKRRLLKLDEALRVAIEVARGLEAAHKKGIVHRDIKSSNIMITRDGWPKIMDFGLAYRGDQARITQRGTPLGTPAYMSPEQARGDTVDRRTDVWALGVVLYEMVAGQLPFRGESGHAVLYSVLHEEPEPLTAVRSGLPLELQRVVEKALAKDSAERYQHIGEMIVDLETLTRCRTRSKALRQRLQSPRETERRAWRWPGRGCGEAVDAFPEPVPFAAPRGAESDSGPCRRPRDGYVRRARGPAGARASLMFQIQPA